MVKGNLNFGGALSKRNFFLVHFFICSFGFLNFVSALSGELWRVLFSGPSTTFNDWVLPFFFPESPKVLLFYVLALISMFLYYSSVYFFIVKRGESFGDEFFLFVKKSNRHFLAYLTILLGSNLIVIYWDNKVWGSLLSSFIQITVWFVVFISPFFFLFWKSRDDLNRQVGREIWVYINSLVLFIIFVQMFAMFLPYLKGELQMMNESLDIPEETRLINGDVNNTEYINKHKIAGLLKYDAEIDKGNSPMPRPGTYIHLPQTVFLNAFIKNHEESYYYNDKLGALVVNRNMSSEERLELNEIFENPEHRKSVDDLYYISDLESRAQEKKDYSEEEIDFIKKNQLELHWQILNRWVIHHHNFVLAPINEYALGRPLQDINMQYGLFNVVLMKFLLEKAGGITYQNYFRLWYAFWPIYYIFFIMLAFILFRDVRYVLLTSVLAFSSLNFLDYQILFLGPGLNPIRHFFDVIIAVCFYFYLRKQSKVFLILGLVFSIVAVFNNKQFGLFVVGAFIATLMVKYYDQDEPISYAEVALVVITAFITAVIVLWVNLGKDSMGSYYLEGFASFPLNARRVQSILLIFSFFLLIYIKFTDVKSKLKYILLYFLLYTGAILLYYIWGATNNHFLNLASIVALCLVILLKFLIDNTSVKRYEKLMITCFTVLSLGFLYIPSLGIYYSAKSQYQRVFSDHKTYEWDLDTAKFKSTMNPKYFVNSIDLIKRYSKNENGIYIISKYDNFLPFLSRKYSAMPFIDVSWFLLTRKEVDLCIDAIKEAKPAYLFVDTDIERSLNGEIISKNLPITEARREDSISRVQRLNELKRIFYAVKEDYEPYEKGLLISVYKRKA